MNCLLAGAPAGTTLDVAAALLTADPGAPVTLLSDDTAGLLAVLDRPELTGSEVLWADPGSPATVDDALVHRRMLHGRPDVVVVVVDDQPDREWALGTILLPRLAGTPLLVTGAAAAALEPRLTALLGELADGDGHAPACAVVPGTDPDAVLAEAARLVRATPVPEVDAGAPLLHGHCAH